MGRSAGSPGEPPLLRFCVVLVAVSVGLALQVSIPHSLSQTSFCDSNTGLTLSANITTQSLLSTPNVTEPASHTARSS